MTEASRSDSMRGGGRVAGGHEETLAAALARACERWSARIALRSPDSVLTYAELADRIRRLSTSYERLGIRSGDPVLCQVGNRPEHLIAAAAAWQHGAIHVALDRELPLPALSAAVHRTGARALVFAPVDDETCRATAEFVQRDHSDLLIVLVGAEPLPGTLSFADLATAPDDGTDDSRPEATDPAAIFTTSGTTGTPKMPMGYHGKLTRSWSRLAEELHFRPDDVHLGHLPLSHGFGLMLATAALLSGGAIVPVERFSRAAVLGLIERERITVFHGSPAHFTMLLGALDEGAHDISSLRIGVASGAAFDRALLAAILDRMGMELMLMYGASEGIGVGTTDRAEMLSGSVGIPVPGSVGVVDENESPVPEGEVGEIVFARELSPVRYWQPPADGTPAGPGPELGTGWYHSGDLGRFDAEGRLYVVGRRTDQINRGGQKVDPREVEEALRGCPEVAEAAVIGVPHDVLGEVVCACVVPAAGRTCTLDALRSALAVRLPRYQLPEELCVLREIPKTTLGKVDPTLLRAAVSAVR
ncbi:class I adenylate-forming enzyme family protein [Nocardia sp. NPDC050175]|uniref:class I adenylate-forming enzyme family protein n=1 Tax=Nocardia sp. NPDC050175 TaxID=3364317 RepID=UPI0037A1FD02